MEAVIFLLVTAVCHGIPIDEPKAPQLLLPIPEITSMVSKDDLNNLTFHEVVTWTKVDSGDPNNPILGYKLKVWEVPKIMITKYKKQGDEIIRVLEESYSKININEIPTGVPNEIVTPANETTATFHDVHVDVAYQFAVQAFTEEGDGPLSAPVRIRLQPRNEVVSNQDGLLGKTETRY